MIDRIVIVEPNDVSVLGARPRPSVTLVTCYPFYYIGSAPHRFIVQASLTKSAATGSWARDDEDQKKRLEISIETAPKSNSVSSPFRTKIGGDTMKANKRSINVA